MRTIHPWEPVLPVPDEPAAQLPAAAAPRARARTGRPPVQPARPGPAAVGLLRRAAHVLLDLATLVVLLAVPVVGTLLGTLLRPGTSSSPLVPAVALVASTGVVLAGATVVWPHHDGGRTAGMRWVGLRVVDRTGSSPARWRLAVRALVLPLDVVVGPVLVLARADGRRLGDLLAGTRLVRDRRPVPATAGRPGATAPASVRARRAARPRRR
ncbi:RDD family protein [Aquipuribacter hungaricus]|uniref:RDD family protein n=1 Tax=Aquipuribacter hungaricus TaxID=545624 RepID=A0ABV7WBS2_9MICO